MTFQFLFTFMVSAKGLSCAVASKAAGQVTGSPACLSARLHILHGQAGCCVLSSLVFAFISRRATWASRITVCWMEKKTQVWLHDDTIALCGYLDLAL